MLNIALNLAITGTISVSGGGGGGDTPTELAFDFITETYTLDGVTVDPADYFTVPLTIDANGLNTVSDPPGSAPAPFNAAIQVMLAGDYTLVIELTLDNDTSPEFLNLSTDTDFFQVYRYSGQIDFYSGAGEEFYGDWTDFASPMRIALTNADGVLTASYNGNPITQYPAFIGPADPIYTSIVDCHVRYLRIVPSAIADADLPALSAVEGGTTGNRLMLNGNPLTLNTNTLVLGN